ncbi:MAG: site-specific integrase [Syntrophales bacterium LBB04]|nr:site-specific integrase [Syntrophales bacterium LBB04]
MLEGLFKYPAAVARHRCAPLFEERDRYLTHCAQQGYAHNTLLRIARELFQIVHLLKIPSGSAVTVEQIRRAAERWARRQCGRGRAHFLAWSRKLFIGVATDWLRCIGRLDEPPEEPPPFEGVIEAFSRWMNEERGLSPVTAHNYCWHLKKFLEWYEAQNRPLVSMATSDVDAFLGSRAAQRWCRVSIASSAKALKAFFSYAGQRGWCDPRIASAIQKPRLFSQETLPSGPGWEDVERLISSVASDQPRDIRNRALLLLFALYGLRSSEVARLRLGDIDWENSRLSVYRPKQRRTQTYPLIAMVGHAIIRYVRTVRPQSSHREVFLTLTAPQRPLSASGLSSMVSQCMVDAAIETRHKGPHALRHACAMRLVSKGLSLKEIGDHLGHRSTSATRIYAKVNLAQLRVVADFDLGGLL